MAVGEEAAVIAFPCIIENFQTHFFEDLLLVGVLVAVGTAYADSYTK